MKYTEQELIDELHRVSEEHCDGETPTSNEVNEFAKYSTMPYKRFGTWNEALIEAGFEVNVDLNITREKLKDELIRISEEYRDGKPPREQDINKHSKYSVRPYKDRFGTWNETLKEFDFELNREKDISRERLIDEILKLSENYDGEETLRQETMENYGDFSSTIYYRRFGSWNQALQTAGLKLNQNMNYSRQDLIDEIKSISEEYCDGESPRQKDMRDYGKYCLNCYYNIFGTWNEALKLSGYGPNNRLNISDDELIEDIKKVAENLNTTPSVPQMEQYGEYATSVYRNRFGSWNQAVQTAGFEPNSKTKNNLSGEDHPFWKGGWETYYGPSWYGQRKKAWERDNHTCRVTGKTEDDIGKRPDVHHINPTWNWDIDNEHQEMNSLDNLICLSPSVHKKLEGRWINASPSEFVKRATEYLDI